MITQLVFTTLLFTSASSLWTDNTDDHYIFIPRGVHGPIYPPGVHGPIVPDNVPGPVVRFPSSHRSQGQLIEPVKKELLFSSLNSLGERPSEVEIEVPTTPGTPVYLRVEPIPVNDTKAQEVLQLALDKYPILTYIKALFAANLYNDKLGDKFVQMHAALGLCRGPGPEESPCPLEHVNDIGIFQIIGKLGKVHSEWEHPILESVERIDRIIIDSPSIRGHPRHKVFGPKMVLRGHEH